jgi:arylsulfatase
VRRWTVALAALLASMGCREERLSSAILISVDTLRPDHLTPYGYPEPTSPHLALLSQTGVRFTEATSVTNWTLPAHMSLLTGLSPSEHKVMDVRDRLPDSVATLAEVFRAAGFETAGVASHTYLKADFGFGRGFDSYQVHPGQQARKVADQAVEWLDHLAEGEPFFLFLHFFDPHWDYRPPRRWAERFGVVDREVGRLDHLWRFLTPGQSIDPEERRQVLGLYDAEIAFTDDQIGRVIDRVKRAGKFDQTVIAVTADHGEEFFEHGTFGHGTHLHGEVTRIPLIVSLPASLPASVRDDRVSQLDIGRMLLELAGVAVPEQFSRRGARLFPEGPGRDRLLVSESTRWGPQRLAVVQGGYKAMTESWVQPIAFRREGEGQVASLLDPIALPARGYDLNADRGEQRDLGLSPPEIEARLAVAMQYALAHAHGFSVECPVGARARVSFSPELPDDAFVVSRPGTVELSRDPERLSYDITYTGAEGAVVFPTRSLFGRARLELDRPSGARKVVSWSGTETPVLAPCSMQILSGDGIEAASLELPAEDRAHLEALGYVE